MSDVDEVLEADAIAAVRRWADEGLGFNCTFVDDDMRVIVGLAQRAVLAGLASDFAPEMQKRFLDASNPHLEGHEKALRFPISSLRSRLAEVERERDKEAALAQLNAGIANEVANERNALAAIIAELREAVKPFADMNRSCDASKPDWQQVTLSAKLSDLRRARAAYEKSGGEDKGGE